MLPNIGFSELLVIFLVVLLLFGAKRLPDIGQALGKSIREFKKAVQGLSGEGKNEDREKKN
ncbi:MAG TPA: twin-arginine translocase TatA/TatE family subunit [Candidatus Omnitrophota bacterium]|nr:twin-arginine translocase TatA/TatE family subunit [Candidatus Omnitrophota bacterium]